MKNKSLKVTKKQKATTAIVKREEVDEALYLEKGSGQKLALVKPEGIAQQQILRLIQRTPKEHVYQRKGKGGENWDYVTGTYVKKVLNYTFGWMWSFEVKSHGREQNTVWVLGRLTIQDKKGRAIVTKEQFGRADIKFKRGSTEMLDYGNDLKAASTDALKKCAAELGVASDIYGKNEFREVKPEVIQTDVTVTIPDTNEVGVYGEEVAKIMEICKSLGAKSPQQVFDLVKDVTGKEIVDWRMKKSEVNEILGELLNRKHQ